MKDMYGPPLTAERRVGRKRAWHEERAKRTFPSSGERESTCPPVVTLRLQSSLFKHKQRTARCSEGGSGYVQREDPAPRTCSLQCRADNHCAYQKRAVRATCIARDLQGADRGCSTKFHSLDMRFSYSVVHCMLYSSVGTTCDEAASTPCLKKSPWRFITIDIALRSCRQSADATETSHTVRQMPPLPCHELL